MENMVNELAAKRQSHIDEINGLNLNKIKAIVRKKNLSFNNSSINFNFLSLIESKVLYPQTENKR